MATFLVTYDLHEQGQNYDCIHKKLKSYTTHWHVQYSVWLIETTQSAVEVRDHLSSCLDSNDKLLIARLSGEAAWKGYSENVTQWLKSRLEPSRQ
jgi:CRISPR/Cas system-associated endoribonuclease Cas2